MTLTLQIANLLRQAIAKLFAAKFKLGTQRQVYLLAGKTLSKPLFAKARKGSRREKSVIGQTDEQLKEWAVLEGGKLDNKMPFIPFLSYAKNPKPDVRPLGISTKRHLALPKGDHTNPTEG